MTITHNCDNAWATAASTVRAGKPDLGMTDFGPALIKEMNRLGMLVDLSHVSHQSMRDILKITKAPVIFSHSSAYGVSKHLRNVPDDVLKTVAKNNGVVMVTFVRTFVNVDDPDSADVNTIVKHIFHIAEVAGWDHVGLGGDYDGTTELPKGLEVSAQQKLTCRIKKQKTADEFEFRTFRSTHISSRRSLKLEPLRNRPANSLEETCFVSGPKWSRSQRRSRDPVFSLSRRSGRAGMELFSRNDLRSLRDQPRLSMDVIKGLWLLYLSCMRYHAIFRRRGYE